ncbi:unnamed protein product [Moneuplotes crassus]|uniref:Uncharacterized protein n=2 Tax=Euplotes crassus TaxID=5936 RepID=A0AAD2D7K3_EUPCR|nr:unnamed protein product [Moneuplotes crassus]
MLFTVYFATGEIIEPVDLQQAEEVIQNNTNKLIGILFVDPTRVDLAIGESNGQQESTISSLFTSIRGMFSSREGRTIYDFAHEISEDMTLLEIDTSGPEYHTLHELFEVENIPYLVLVYCNEIQFRGIPSRKNSKEIENIIASFGTSSGIDRYCSEGHMKAISSQGENQAISESSAVNSTINEIISAGRTPQYASSARTDPFYFGDNEAVYESRYYTNPMNGGLISNSQRYPKMVTNLSPVRPRLEVKPPQERISVVDTVTYYDDYSNRNIVRAPPTEITNVNIEETSAPIELEAPEEIFEEPLGFVVEQAQPWLVQEKVVELECDEVEAEEIAPPEEEPDVFHEIEIVEEPLETKQLEFNHVEPVVVQQVEVVHKPEVVVYEPPERTVVTPAYIEQKEPDKIVPVRVPQLIVNKIKPVSVPQKEPIIEKPEPENIQKGGTNLKVKQDQNTSSQSEMIQKIIENRVEIHDQPIIEVIEQPIVEFVERPPIYLNQYPQGYAVNQDPKLYYQNQNIQSERKDISTEAEILSKMMRGQRTSIPKPSINFQPPENVEVREKFEKVLEDEQSIVERINTLYEEDKALQAKMKQSEKEIQKSESQYNRAKRDIDRTIQESEKRMGILEKKLSELYIARDMALKARETLYQPCSQCKTDDAPPDGKIVRKHQKVPRRVMPSDQSNFHDFYESSLHQQKEGGNSPPMDKKEQRQVPQESMTRNMFGPQKIILPPNLQPKAEQGGDGQTKDEASPELSK